MRKALNMQSTQNQLYPPFNVYTCKHTWTHIHIHRHTQTHSQANFYWTRIQLLNPASGSMPSLLLHLDKSALISADSPCPPSILTPPPTHTHTHTHTRLQLIPIRVWLNENCDAYFSIPGSMNTNERQISQSLACASVNDKEKEWDFSCKLRSHVALWMFFIPFISLLFIRLHDIWIFIVPSA